MDKKRGILYLLITRGFIFFCAFILIMAISEVFIGKYSTHQHTSKMLKLADKGDDYWHIKDYHQAFHKYWIWFQRTQFEISKTRVNLILSRIVLYLDNNDKTDVAYQIYNDLDPKKFTIIMDIALKRKFNKIMQSNIDLDRAIKKNHLSSIHQYILNKGKNSPEFLIKTAKDYWAKGHNNVADKLVSHGVNKYFAYTRGYYKNRIKFSIGTLVEMEKCEEASFLYGGMGIDTHDIKYLKVKIENCRNQSEVLFSLLLKMKALPDTAIVFSDFGYADFNDAARHMVKLNMDAEAIQLAAHEQRCDTGCGSDYKAKLAKIFSSVGKHESITNVGQIPVKNENKIEGTLNELHSFSDIYNSLKEGVKFANLAKVMESKQKRFFKSYQSSMSDKWELDKEMDQLVNIYLLLNRPDSALKIAKKSKNHRGRDERLQSIALYWAKQKVFAKALALVESTIIGTTIKEDSLIKIAVKMAEANQIENALKVITNIEDKPRVFERLAFVSVDLKLYKQAISYAYKSQSYNLEKVFKDLFMKMIPKLNSSEKLEVLSYALDHINLIKKDNYYNLREKVQVMLGKYYISAGYIDKGLDLIERSLLKYPDIALLISVDLYLKDWKIELKDEVKVLKVGMDFRDSVNLEQDESTYANSTRNRYLFQINCEVCKNEKQKVQFD